MKNKIKILMLEDVLTDLELVLMELEKAKFQFTYLHVETEEGFIKGLHEFKPDLILSDYSLPQFNGMQALKLAKEISPLIPFIIITGSINEDTAVECMKAGATDYVIKQNLIRLCSTVNQALDKKALIEARIKAEEALREESYNLNERVKELNCLYKISQLVETRGISDDEFFQGVVDLIPAAFRYPGITVCRLLINDKEYKTEKFLNTEWNLMKDIFIDDVKSGAIEVYQLKKLPVIENEQFLKEENDLVAEIAERLGHIIERQQSEEKIKHLNRVLRAVRNVNQLITKEKDRDRLIKRACENMVATRGYFNAWIALWDDSGKYLTSTEVNYGKDFFLVIELMKSGKLTACGKEALKKKEVITIKNPTIECKDCPLSGKFENRSAMTFRLEYEGKIYGLISVSIPRELITDEEEHNLFKEMAEDISFALHSIEAEKKSKQTEESLQESERKYRHIFESIQDVYYETNLEGEILEISPSIENLSKGQYTRDALIGKKMSDYYLKPEARDEFIRALLKHKRIADYEITLKNKDGSPIICSISSMLHFDSNGKPGKIIGSMRDISMRIKLEDELRDSEIRYHNLFENSSEFLFTLDLKGNFTDVNKAAENLTGYKKSELLKMNFKDYSSKRAQRKLLITFSNIYKTGKPLHDLPVEAIMKDGSKKYFETSFSLLKKGEQVIGYQGSSKDITERKKAGEIQQALYNISNALNTIENLSDLYSKIRDFLGTVIDTTNFYIALYDENTNMLSFSYYADETFDKKDYLPSSRVFGKGLSEYVISSGKLLFASRQLQDELAEQGIIEIAGARSEVWLGVPLKVENRVIGVIAVQSYDNPNLYTEKDMEILTFISEAIARVVEHKQAEEHIRRDLKEKTLLLQEVHHRTKNNLQTICSLMQMQENTIRTKEDAIKSFKVTQDRIRAMAKAYEILLRSEYMSELKLSDYIQELADQLARNYDIYGKVNIKYSMDDVLFNAEKLSKLGLIINEIITNSMKYAFEGRDEGNIHIILKDAKDHITIKISDDGIGIPESIKIPNTKTLGLSLVDMLIGEFQGTYSVDRKNGTSFTMKIPKERINQ